jgi:lipopolysaccharide export system ATP-binding protein
MPLLEVRGLVKFYGRRKVVDGVNFEVDAGEVVGLLGPNGAGKTTSFRMTTGQVARNAGHVYFNGQDIGHLPMYLRARRGMGYLSQEKSVFRKLTVEQNILAILEAIPMLRSLGRRPTRRERYQRMDTVLDQFGLNKVRKNYGARLSGGETRRLEIARCLVCEPLLILMDEPFTGIDPKTIADIQQIVRDLRSQGIGILITDHNVRETLKITERSYLIKDGQVLVHGTPHQIINDPVAIQAYLGTGFNDNPFATPPAAAPRPASKPPEEAVRLVVEQEKVHRLIERLKTDDHANAAAELVKRGLEVMPAVIEAMERRDPDMRTRAYEVLHRLLPGVVFEPCAPEAIRKQQIALLRETLERKAG